MARKRYAVVELALPALLVAAQLLLAARLLDTDTFFDEGFYLTAVDALRHGQELGTEVFTAQPPGYYRFLEAAQATFGRGIEELRLAHVLVVCAGVVAAYALGRLLVGRLAGVVGSGALVVAYPLPLFVPRVLADPPGVAVALVAVGLAAWAARREGRAGLALAVAAGAALAAATLVKLYAPPALPALAVMLAPHRRDGSAASPPSRREERRSWSSSRWHTGALGELWQGAVTYHEEAKRLGYLDNVAEVRQVLNPRIPSTWIAAVGLVVALAAVALRRPLPGAALWTWPLLGLGLGLVLWHDPLLEHHLVVFAGPRSAPAGSSSSWSARASRRRSRAARSPSSTGSRASSTRFARSLRRYGVTVYLEPRSGRCR